MGNNLSLLHRKVSMSKLDDKALKWSAYPGIHTPVYQKTAKSIRIQKLRKSPYKHFFSGFFRKTVLGNVVRKLHAKFHWGSLIRKCFKIGGAKSLPKKQKKRKILILEQFWHIYRSRKNHIFSNFEIEFSATYWYRPGESINNLGKGLLHWKSFN